jgi:hypothetical protein
MKVQIVRSGGQLGFEFGPEPVALSRLRVLDSSGAIMWDLVPLTFAATPVNPASGAFVELPDDSAGAVLEALKGAVQDLSSDTGRPGEDVLGALSVAIATRQRQHELSDETAVATLEALRRLGHAWKRASGAPSFGTGERQREAAAGRASWARVRRISYGEVPEGYRQLHEPRTLTTGEAYSVAVLGAEAFDVGHDSFVA